MDGGRGSKPWLAAKARPRTKAREAHACQPAVQDVEPAIRGEAEDKGPRGCKHREGCAVPRWG